MNIYADRGNIAVLERRCRWRGIGFELARAGPGDARRSRRTRPPLHRRRPGPRPGARGARPGRDQARRAREARRERGRRCSRSAAATSCSATPTRCPDGESLPGLGLVDLRTVREPGARLIGNVVIEADLGDGPRRLAGFENHGGRTYLGEGEQPLGQRRVGLRQQRQRRLRGRAPRPADRHLPARPAAAEERLARGPADRVGARARGSASRPSSSRSTTGSSDARTSARCSVALGANASADVVSATRRSSRSRLRPGRSRQSVGLRELDTLDAGTRSCAIRSPTSTLEGLVRGRCSAAARAPRRGSRRRSGRAR